MVSTMETLAPEERNPVTPAPGSETIRLQPTTGFSRVLAPRELWRYRDLAGQIALRDITVRYRQTALGGAWAVLQPIGFMVVFSLIFGNVAGISSDGLPYPLFSLAALVPWTFFSTAVLLGSDSLVSNSALVSKIYFPPILMLPVLVAIAAAAALGVSAALSAINVRYRDVRYVVPFAIQIWLFATPV